ncbi:MAG TPA: tetratricopeptide repeat protein [Polyangiaceae bacterium]|nr:tetratricopeptide repeat protein [Polyangiaceae bacterium]
MRFGALAALSLSLLAARAQAEPSLWGRVIDPNAQPASKARQRAEQLFDYSRQAGEDPEALRELSLGGAALLELSGGVRRDPWQAVLLGRILLDAQPGRERDAVRLLEQGLSGLPDSDFKLESWFDLGIGAMKIGDFARAEDAFAAALALAWDPDDRARCYRNRGRARLLSGQMMAAVADYRSAVRLARDTLGSALSHLGLGVTLERSGDYPQGMLEVARSVAMRIAVPPSSSVFVLDVPGLTWVPEYDEHYFRALAAMSEAEQTDDTDTAEAAYESALVSWEQYLPAAEAQKDRFVANAKRHQKRCLEALERLQQAPVPRRSGRVR